MKTWGVGYEKSKKKAKEMYSKIGRVKRIKYKANRHGEKILIESEANFWIFAQKIKSCAIKVIIRQLNNGNKHFLSEWAIALKLIIKIKETKNPPKNRRFFVVSAISLNADRD